MLPPSLSRILLTILFEYLKALPAFRSFGDFLVRGYDTVLLERNRDFPESGTALLVERLSFSGEFCAAGDWNDQTSRFFHTIFPKPKLSFKMGRHVLFLFPLTPKYRSCNPAATLLFEVRSSFSSLLPCPFSNPPTNSPERRCLFNGLVRSLSPRFFVIGLASVSTPPDCKIRPRPPTRSFPASFFCFPVSLNRLSDIKPRLPRPGPGLRCFCCEREESFHFLSLFPGLRLGKAF